MGAWFGVMDINVRPLGVTEVRNSASSQPVYLGSQPLKTRSRPPQAFRYTHGVDLHHILLNKCHAGILWLQHLISRPSLQLYNLC